MTVLKNFITYTFSVILSCILHQTHKKNPLFLETQGEQIKKIVEFVNIHSYRLNFYTDVNEQIIYCINSIQVAAYCILYVTMVTRVERSKCNNVSCAPMVDVHDS
jgi:hypothetical protein